MRPQPASRQAASRQMAASQRQRLLDNTPLEAFTPKTLTAPEALEAEIRKVKRQGFALDNEEFLPGLLCVAVAVPSAAGRSNLCVAVQAPMMRLTADKALALLPALQRAAAALSRIETDATPAGQAAPNLGMEAA